MNTNRTIFWLSCTIVSFFLSATACSSGGTSTGDTTASSTSSGGTSSGGSGCTQPAIAETKTLGDLTAAEYGAICDWSACKLGGYGKKITCADGSYLNAPASQSACTATSYPATCKATLAQAIACQQEIYADPCKATTIVASSSNCAAIYVPACKR